VLLCVCLILSGCSWLDKVRGHPTLEAQSLMEQAEQAEAKGDIERAGYLLHEAIDANPEDVEGHRELARLSLKQGKIDTAVEHLRLAIEQNPDDIDSYVQLTRIQLDYNRLDGAEREIAAALSIDPQHVQALLLKAELAERRGRAGLAMETYYRVLSRESENVRARLRLAELQIAAGRPDRAAPLLRSLCECPAANQQQKAEALWSLGDAYGKSGRWRDAAAALAAAVPHREMQVDDWYRLAYAHYAAKDYRGAWLDIDRALQSNPGHPRALAMRGILSNQSRPGYPNNAQRMAMAAPAPSGW
jgi:tetratricopeptide (TPR) repeat protein